MAGRGLEPDRDRQAHYRGEIVGLLLFSIDSCRLRCPGGTRYHWPARNPGEPTEFKQDLRVTWRHIGTTRMPSSAIRGVVDPNGKAHAVDTLYIIGSSVFPTCGAAWPTLATIALTIIALAHRLSDYLAGK